MKTFNEKSHLIIGVGIVVLIMFIVFKFLYQPSADKKAQLEGEIATVTEEDVDALRKELKQETDRSEEEKKELEKMYQVKQFGYLDYTKMMDYVGEKATETGVEIITLEKKDVRQNGKHYEVPYNITLKGKYENLLMFVDSLYQIERYMQISNFLINQKPSSEDIEKVQNDNSSKYAAWMNAFAQKLNKDLKEEMEKATTTTEDSEAPATATGSSGQSYYEEFAKLQKTESNILDLEMEVMFISMDPVYE